MIGNKKLSIIEDENGQFIYDKGEFIPLAFTVKKLGSKNEMEDYIPVFEKWSHLTGVGMYPVYYEEDSKGILHAHGIILVQKNFYKKRLQTEGYYIYTTDCYHIENWHSYIQKSQYFVPKNNVYLF